MIKQKLRLQRGGGKIGKKVTDVIHDGVVEAAIVGESGVSGADDHPPVHLRALRVLKLSRHGPEPRSQLGHVTHRPEVVGVDELVLVVAEPGELDSQSHAVAATAIAALRLDTHVVPRVVLVGPELHRHPRVAVPPPPFSWKIDLPAAFAFVGGVSLLSVTARWQA